VLNVNLTAVTQSLLMFVEVRDLISQCLSIRPCDRPTLEAILRHPWMALDTSSASSNLLWRLDYSEPISWSWQLQHLSVRLFMSVIVSSVVDELLLRSVTYSLVWIWRQIIRDLAL